MNQERNRPLTAEDLIRRYDLENLKTVKKNIKVLERTLQNQHILIRQYIQNVSNYNNQVNSTTWFYNGTPTLDNEPYILFDDDKDEHINDLYYDRDNGKVYIFSFDGTDYSWEEVKDGALVQSLAIANSEADAQDNRRNIYYQRPAPPYEIGDVWVDGNIIMRCRCSRDEGEFSDTDWVEQDYYSDSGVVLDVKAVLDQFETLVTTEYATRALLETTAESINSKVETNTNTLTERLDATNSSVEEVKTTYKSALEELDKSFNLSLDKVEETIVSNNDSVNQRINEIHNYLTYQLEQIDGQEVGVLTLGASTSDVKLKLINDIVYFEQNGSRVAYISNNKLYITDSEFLNSVQIGNFAFIPRGNGSLGFRKVV